MLATELDGGCMASLLFLCASFIMMMIGVGAPGENPLSAREVGGLSFTGLVYHGRIIPLLIDRANAQKHSRRQTGGDAYDNRGTPRYTHWYCKSRFDDLFRNA